MNEPTNQQPIKRTVGRRQSRASQPLTSADRAAMTCMAPCVTHAPKGVFRHRSHVGMAADRLRWIAALSKLPDHATVRSAALSQLKK